jgi:hypothetical protein
MQNSLNTLLQHPAIWRGDQCAEIVQPGISTGFAELDSLLPGGGWPVGALTEIITDQEGVGELRLALPALSNLSQSGRWLTWVAPPHIPYAPALSAAGIRLSRLLIARPTDIKDILWATEQALRSGQCGAVLAWLPAAADRALRRLQLAAEAGQCCGILYRPKKTASLTSPAALRLHVSASPDKGIIRILKRRGSTIARPVTLDLDQSSPQKNPRPIGAAVRTAV